MRDLLEGSFAKNGIHCDALAFERLESYFRLLVRANETMNLTAIVEREAVAYKHFLDSALLLRLAPFEQQALQLVDVGSGAGFPGLVLKILRPSWQITLVDGLAKRLRFIEATAAELGLSDGLQLLHARAEDLGKDAAHRERFDIATARAVADLRLLAELCLPLVRVGGAFAAMKGPTPEAECHSAAGALQKLGGGAAKVFPLEGEGFLHSAVLVEKRRQTPAAYPRAFGMIKKKPL